MEAAFIIVSLLVSFAIFLMWDLHRSQSCRWCEHCRKAEREREERVRRERHVRYHAYRPVPLDDCHDPDCPGR